uniref:hypothetical protein n=1 Tax=Gemmiger sp. TaxID=2049027 RepID=UPI003FED4A8F
VQSDVALAHQLIFEQLLKFTLCVFQNRSLLLLCDKITGITDSCDCFWVESINHTIDYNDIWLIAQGKIARLHLFYTFSSKRAFVNRRFVL